MYVEGTFNLVPMGVHRQRQSGVIDRHIRVKTCHSFYLSFDYEKVYGRNHLMRLGNYFNPFIACQFVLLLNVCLVHDDYMQVHKS